MRKIYFYLVALIACVTFSTNVMAEGKTAYAAIADPIVENGGILSFDLSAPGQTTYVIDDMWMSTTAAAMAEGKYYGIVQDNSGYNSKEFCIIDFEAKTKSKLGDGANLFDMTYDVAAKVMYGITTGMNNEGVYTTISTINLADGTLTEYYSLNKVLFGIAADGKGHLYAIGLDDPDKSEAKLYEIDIKNKACVDKATLATDGTKYSLTFQGFDMTGQSIEFYEDKLYWLADYPKMLATIDIQNGNVTKIGNINFEEKLTGLCFSMTTNGGNTPDPEPEIDYTKTVTVKTYGDSMGTTEDLTKVETFFYNADNNLIRSTVQPADLQPWYYYAYVYNDDKQLSSQSFRQWGQYDGLYKCWSEEKGKETYQYSEGKLARKDVDERYYTYEWEGNNLVKETEYALDKYHQYEEGDYYKLNTYTYSEFVEGAANCPKKVSFVGKYNSYNGEYTYDDNHNKTSFVAYKLDGTTKDSKETWEYNENGELIENIVYKVKDGEFIPKSKTTYTIKGNETKKETYEYSQKRDENDKLINEYEWRKKGLYNVITTSECYGTLAPTDLTVTPATDKVNTIVLTFNAPAVLAIEQPEYYVYRDGNKIGTATFDEKTSKYTYTDETVANGDYDYFVQTANSETGDTYNVSNVVNYKIHTELPLATNIRYVSHEITKEGTYNVYNVTVGWDAPDTGLEIKGYNVYYNRFGNNGAIPKTPEKENVTETSTSLAFGSTIESESLKRKVVVETIYSIGRIKTEPIEIDLSSAVSIENNSLKNMVQVSDNTILINEEYTSLEILGTNGMLIGRYSNTPMIDITSLAQGIYIINVVRDNTHDTIKLIKR